jgi:hypothetical protein
MVATARTTSAADINREERARRSALMAQYWRVRDYQPVLERRVAALEKELAETRDHLKREYMTADDLLWESTATPKQIERRDEERARAAAAA